MAMFVARPRRVPCFPGLEEHQHQPDLQARVPTGRGAFQFQWTFVVPVQDCGRGVSLSATLALFVSFSVAIFSLPEPAQCQSGFENFVFIYLIVASSSDR